MKLFFLIAIFDSGSFGVEICSAHPTSGGPYFWAARMVPEKYAPIASWVRPFLSRMFRKVDVVAVP